MKKILILFTLNLVVLNLATAQNTRRGWEKGPLTWSDFTPMNESIGNEHSYLEYLLDVELRKDEINGREMQTRTAVLYVDRAVSWVDTHFRTPQQLHYNQVAFNLAELHRRRLQLVIDTGGIANMNYYSRLLAYEIDSFCRETYYGADTAAVAQWEWTIRQQMDSITPLMVEQHQRANSIEKIIPRGALLFNLGLGTKFYAGEVAQLFAPSGGMYFDLEGGWWRNVLTMGFYIGGGRCRPDTIVAVNTYNNLIHDDRITTIDLNINYGFTVLNTSKWCVTPFVGYGMQGIFYNENEDATSGGPTEGCWRAGVDVKYHMAVDDTYTRTSLERFLCSAQGKIFLSRDKFKSIVDSPTGVTINAQVGISFGMKEAKIRRAVKAGAQ